MANNSLPKRRRQKFSKPAHLPTYRSWFHLVSRCTNPEDKNYKWYGGKGIKVCAEWLNSYEQFLEDMGERPEDTSIDRIDSAGNYEKSNCRWSGSKTQSRNRPTWCIYIEIEGVTRILTEWCEIYGISCRTARQRINLGWNEVDAVSTPVGKRGYRQKYKPAIFLTFKGETKTVVEWSEISGVPPRTIKLRLSRGLTVEQALTLSSQGNRSKFVSKLSPISIES